MNSFGNILIDTKTARMATTFPPRVERKRILSRKQRRKLYRWQAWNWRFEKESLYNPIVEVAVELDKYTQLHVQKFHFADGSVHCHIMQGTASSESLHALGCDPRTPIRISSE